MLKQKISVKPHFSLVSFLEISIDLIKERERCSHLGVKYPVHFRRIDFLLDHFDDVKIIFLTRNPLDIVSSKLNDPATKRRKNHFFMQPIMHYATLLYFSFEYNYSAVIYKKFNKQVKLIKYESLVEDLEPAINGLCAFVGIDSSDRMLNVTGKKSSYDGASETGVYRSSIGKYKKNMHKFDILLVKFITCLFSRCFK